MQTLSQNLTETLRDWLLHGRLKPGERIEEVPLALTMGVSRTPVRAALATLASEGLIDHQPKRGYLVKEFALAAILAAYEVRAVLEGLAGRSAGCPGSSCNGSGTAWPMATAYCPKGACSPRITSPTKRSTWRCTTR